MKGDYLKIKGKHVLFKGRTEIERQRSCCHSSGLHLVLLFFPAGHQGRLPHQAGRPGQGKEACVASASREERQHVM